MGAENCLFKRSMFQFLDAAAAAVMDVNRGTAAGRISVLVNNVEWDVVPVVQELLDGPRGSVFDAFVRRVFHWRYIVGREMCIAGRSQGSVGVLEGVGAAMAAGGAGGGGRSCELLDLTKADAMVDTGRRLYPAFHEALSHSVNRTGQDLVPLHTSFLDEAPAAGDPSVVKDLEVMKGWYHEFTPDERSRGGVFMMV
jgi:hypothetical protein